VNLIRLLSTKCLCESSWFWQTCLVSVLGI
jgi:hypothetical protein